MNIRPTGAELFYTDGRTDMPKLTAAFRILLKKNTNLSRRRSLQQKRQNALIWITQTFADLSVRANSPQMSFHLRLILTSTRLPASNASL